MLQISCAFPTSLRSPDLAKVAENLGYHRAWMYDTPQQSPDVWMMLALAAAKTERIGLGPGVLVPSLRHPMVNAAGAAGLVALAPGRVAIGFGTGFTGRRAMGYRSVSWAATVAHVDAFKALLRGETIEWEGATMRMLHSDSNAPARPIEVPIILSAFGPKGTELTRQCGYGLFGAPGTFPPGAFDWVACMTFGTVRDAGEDPHSDRVLDAAGAGWSLNYHLAYEYGGADAVGAMPGGEAWLESINRHPASERHFAIHGGHLMTMNEADRAAWAAGGSAILEHVTVTGTASEVRARLAEYEALGITEVVYQPMGPAPERELERFLAASRT